MRLSQLQRRYTIVRYHNGWPAEDIITFDRLPDVDEWLIANITPERRYRVRVDSPNEQTYYLTDRPTTVAGRDFRPRYER
ncbi:hypothetical protein ACVI1L_000011 [Bradyrhizobium sp. USDA 4516]